MNTKNTKSILTLAIAALASSYAQAALMYSQGHADIGVGYEAGAFDLHFHAHSGAVIDGSPLGADTEYEADEVITLVPYNPADIRPAGAAFNPIGVSAGTPIWLLPQAEDINKPFLGIATEELDPGDWLSNISIRLTGISGSGVTAGGDFSLYTTDSFNVPTFYWTSSDGLDLTDLLEVPAGEHNHFWYAFTQAGTYDITLEVSGTHALDGLVTQSATYTFEVAPVPEPTTALVGIGTLGFAAFSRRRRARA